MDHWLQLQEGPGNVVRVGGRVRVESMSEEPDYIKRPYLAEHDGQGGTKVWRVEWDWGGWGSKCGVAVPTSSGGNGSRREAMALSSVQWEKQNPPLRGPRELSPCLSPG